MVAKFCGREWQQSDKAFVATCDSTTQRIVLKPAVIAHVQCHRQTRLFASEAGGQLFGVISSDVVSVEIATGPYRGDERSRFRYRSNARAAQETIELQKTRGLLYLGEWHSHAEDHPNASSLDINAMQLLIANSHLNSSALLMLIVGRKKTEKGLALFTASRIGSEQWSLSPTG
jgi:integrative and conjugative element protein (TIGR02256 family)